jgi:hypothetical protein
VRAVVTGVGIAGGGLFIGTAFKLARAARAEALGHRARGGLLRRDLARRVSLFAVLPVAILLGWLAARRGVL